MATAGYTINDPISQPAAASPSFSPAAGTYTTSQSVTLRTTTLVSTIYYTTNGTVPTTSSSVYSGTITVSSSETLEAIAVETSYTTSAVATAGYTINYPTSQPAATAPSFSPAAGSYTETQSVAISTTTPGAKIYYTTNGTPPTTSSSVYGGPITVSSSVTLEALAAETGEDGQHGGHCGLHHRFYLEWAPAILQLHGRCPTRLSRHQCRTKAHPRADRGNLAGLISLSRLLHSASGLTCCRSFVQKLTVILESAWGSSFNNAHNQHVNEFRSIEPSS